MRNRSTILAVADDFGGGSVALIGTGDFDTLAFVLVVMVVVFVVFVMFVMFVAFMVFVVLVLFVPVVEVAFWGNQLVTRRQRREEKRREEEEEEEEENTVCFGSGCGGDIALAIGGVEAGDGLSRDEVFLSRDRVGCDVVIGIEMAESY